MLISYLLEAVFQRNPALLGSASVIVDSVFIFFFFLYFFINDRVFGMLQGCRWRTTTSN